MKLLQIDGQQNDMQDNDGINMRKNTVNNEKNIACESCHTKMTN
jgi:hypothetical protein